MDKKRIAEYIAFGVVSVALLVMVGMWAAALAQRNKLYNIIVSQCEATSPAEYKSYCEASVNILLLEGNE